MVKIMKNEKNIYILLTDTGTVFTRLIKLYTKAPFNHASIAFDRELKEVYSFGRLKPHNPLIGGFVKENIRGPLFIHAKCALYCCAVEPSAYEQVRRHVRRFERNRHQYKYNLIGLLGVLLNINLRRENAYFCSEFVASVFQENGVDIIDKPSALTTPGDFEKSEALRLLYQGKLVNYRSRASKIA